MRQFNGFDALANHFAQVVARMPTVKRDALDAVGKHIEAAAKAKLGTYQQAAGPFAAWAPLSPVTLANPTRQQHVGGKDSPLLVTAEMQKSIEHKVVASAVHIGSDDPKADYQERGTERIPPRSFLGSSLFERQDLCRLEFMRRICKLIETGQ